MIIDAFTEQENRWERIKQCPRYGRFPCRYWFELNPTRIVDYLDWCVDRCVDRFSGCPAAEGYVYVGFVGKNDAIMFKIKFGEEVIGVLKL